MQVLIRRLSRENRLWSAERIHDHLAQLGFDPPHPNTIRKYMVKPAPPQNPSQTWLTFLRNHLDESWAIDFCTVPTATFSVLFGNGVTAFVEACGVEEVHTVYRSPWQNPFVERFFGTPRRELLNHIIPFNDRHLYRLVEESVRDYYHSERPHQGLKGDTPIPHQPHTPPVQTNKLISIPILGGLHHKYERMAA